MANDKTLVIIKPDGLKKSLTGNIITALSETKLKIVGAKVVKVPRELAEKHYSKLKENLIAKQGKQKGEKLYENILDYLTGKFHTNRVFAMVWSGEDAIEKLRNVAGETNPEKADSISIRGKYGRINSETNVMENVIHVSDSVENAIKEIALWFNPDEIVE